MKLISWNVNGMRAILKKNFKEFMAEHDPDILCLQEVKAHREQVGDLPEDDYHVSWNPAERRGYSGVAILSKVEPLDVRYGMDSPDYDKEGRVITHEYPDFYLVTVYTPNSKSQLERLEYRQKEWDPLFLNYCKELEKKKPVIFCGDLNVAHREIDLARPDDNRRNAGFTDEEREGFDNIVQAGFVDTFRELNGDKVQYTWWSYRTRARERGIGWRIDYFCASPALMKRVREANILDQVMGSDHCPVELILK